MIRFLLVVVLFCLSGCKTLRDPRTGESIGEKGGSVLGAIVGDAAGNEQVGNIIGSSLGGATGAALLKSLENQVRELSQKLPDAKVTRRNDSILVELNNRFLFTGNKTIIKKEGLAELDSFAQVMQEYRDSKISIFAYTDNRGAEKQNLLITRRRAESVSAYLKTKNLSAERLQSAGAGEARPRYPNTTEAGRNSNRRVEFVLTR